MFSGLFSLRGRRAIWLSDSRDNWCCGPGHCVCFFVRTGLTVSVTTLLFQMISCSLFDKLCECAMGKSKVEVKERPSLIRICLWPNGLWKTTRTNSLPRSCSGKVDRFHTSAPALFGSWARCIDVDIRSTYQHAIIRKGTRCTGIKCR